MEKLGLNEIREKFLSFFESKEHLRLKSASLVPQNDKSLLLINSGMAPLKPYFTGQQIPPRNRVTTCQKCIRTPDIERVGKTARHGTFFEMLGNFSFGDYFKEEAISWAWEFCTEVLNLPSDRLWVSIYENDDEAFEIWNKMIGIPANKIVRMGKEDNFWEIGLGPCGPCSEIYFDRGEERGCGKPDCKVGCDCDRYIEFWNLVFTQFDKDEEGNYNRLAKPNIDTGMGLERMAVVIQDVSNLFEVDTIKYILDFICKIAGVQYGKDDKTDTSVRVITDHIRGVTFMTSDGILPSNEGRGYVLRRLLRRAARHGKLLGIKGSFLSSVAEKVIEVSGKAYPELLEKKEYILNIIDVEEKKFDETIDQGLEILQGFISEMKLNNNTILSGADAFKLYDTYGFPLDLTKDILEEHSLKVDEEGFNQEMQLQRERARAARVDSGIEGWKEDIYSKLDSGITTKFIGYEKYNSKSIIKAIISEGKLLNSAKAEDNVELFLDITPFYAESGGQISDTGIITGEGFEVEIFDCKKVTGERFAHIGKVKSGVINVGDSCNVSIDVDRRKSIARNHSATHLLHKALRNVLGSHVEQAGSLVTPDRIRFDFTHYKAMSEEEIDKVEKEVNEIILNSLDATIKETSLDEAKKIGATALFGEKYGDIVRVVKFGDYSIELCGGTHIQNTSQAGLFTIISEGGVASGVRRIEALTGRKAYEYFREKEIVVEELSNKLKTVPNECIKKVDTILKQLKDLEKEISILRSKLVSSDIDRLLEDTKEVKGVKYLAVKIDNMDIDSLRNLGDKLRDRIKSGVVVLSSSDGEKNSIIVMASKEAVEKGVHSGNLIKELAKVANGSGGGRPDMAQGGIKDISKLDEALCLIPNILENQIK